MAERETLVPAPLEGYASEIGAALWRLEDTRERTLRAIGPLRDEHLDREVQGNTLGAILYHVALIETDWLYAEILGTPVPPEVASLLPADDRDEAGVLTTVRGQTLEQHVARLGVVRSALLDAMHGMSVDEFHRPRALPTYDVSPAWVLHHLTQHEAEHRGEIESIIASMRRARV